MNRADNNHTVTLKNKQPNEHRLYYTKFQKLVTIQTFLAVIKLLVTTIAAAKAKAPVLVHNFILSDLPSV